MFAASASGSVRYPTGSASRGCGTAHSASTQSTSTRRDSGEANLVSAGISTGHSPVSSNRATHAG